MYLKVIVNVFISLIFVISFLKGPFQSFKQFFSSRVHGIIIQVNPNLINIKMSDWPVSESQFILFTLWRFLGSAMISSIILAKQIEETIWLVNE